VKNITVDSFQNGAMFSLWSNHVVGPGQKLILTQTNGQNFDTSDQPIQDESQRSNAQPKIHFDITDIDNNTFHFDLTDSGQILNTGGFDLGTRGGWFNTNEALGWRDVGTTGINDPGGDQAVPEPATLALLGLGLAGMAGYRWRRRQGKVS
jgi:hypothetical protein